MILPISEPWQAAPLFGTWEQTILWSCLQGIMGTVYVNHPSHPTAAAAVLGDFTFLAGAEDPELAAFLPPAANPSFRLLIPQHTGWIQLLLQLYGNAARQITRYATAKDPAAFQADQLESAVSSLAPEYRLRPICRRLYDQCRKETWSQDLVSQFPDYETYARLGLGVAVLWGDQLIAGASSYARYRDGIEIEVDTREDHRRRGAAYAACARLILTCRERQLYPSWDAHTRASLSLAEKLGYRLHHAYTAVELTGLPPSGRI